MSIKRCLLNKLNYLKNVKADNELEGINNRKYKIKKVLNKLKKREPELLSFIKNDKNNKFQKGGVNDTYLENRINAIKKIIELYNKAKEKSDPETILEAKTSIEDLVKKINNMNIDDLMDKEGKLKYSLNEEAIENTMNILQTVIYNTDKYFEIDKLRGQVNLPINEVISKKDISSKEYSDLEYTFNKLKNELEEENNKTEKNKIEEGKIKKIIDDIKENNNKRREIIGEQNNDDENTLIGKYRKLTKSIIEKIEIIDKETYGEISKDKIIIKNSGNNITNNDIKVISDKEFNKEPYNGNYTKRIDNSLFSKDTEKMRKNITEEIVHSLEEGKDKDILEKIYNPNFKDFIEKRDIQSGGDEDSIMDVVTTGQKIDWDLRNVKNEYMKKVDEYNLIHNHYIQHNAFIMLIITGQIVQTDSYVMYQCINGGIISFYHNILKSMKEDIEKRNTGVAIYLKKYHYLTIQYLFKFFDIILGKEIETDNKIDIDNSGDKIKYYFHIFNHFKKVMDNYKRLNMNAITIYSRINDFGKIPEKIEDRVFMSDNGRKISEEQFRHERLNVKLDNCKNEEGKDEYLEYLFTEVFDSEKFKEPLTISNYMALPGMIADGLGIAMMTYGYSGVGKTFTLFGDSKNSKKGESSPKGILQATLESINGLDKVEMRFFELYGRGVIYPNYWKSTPITTESMLNDNMGKKYINEKRDKTLYCPLVISDDNKVYQKLTNYDVSWDGSKDSLKVSDSKDVDKKDIPKFTNKIGDYENTYYSVSGDDVRSTFKNISNLIEDIDSHRKEKGTIRETPNNPESSRSMMVYDFRLHIGDKKGEKAVPFVIIDLPGREEIIETYVDTFLDTLFMKEKFNSNILKELKYALTALTLNPLMLPIFYQSHLNDDTNDYYEVSGYNTLKIIKTGKKQLYNIILHEYNKLDSTIKEKVRGKEQFKNIMDVTINPEKEINMERYFKNSMDPKGNILFENNDEYSYPIFKIENIKIAYNFDFQYFSGFILEIINRLFLLGEFRSLDKIFKKVLDILINDNIDSIVSNMNEDDINKYLKNYFSDDYDISKSIDEKRNTLKDKAKFDYITTPSEGIFINENIAGLIQYLSKTLTKSGKDAVDKQDDSLDHESQIKKIRYDVDLKNCKNGVWKGIYESNGIECYTKDKSTQKKAVGETATLKEKTKFFSQSPSSRKKEDETEAEGQESSKKSSRSTDKCKEISIKEQCKGNTPVYKSKDDNKPIYDLDRANEIYDLMKEQYKSDRIFNKDNPIVENILCPYLSVIDDYKVFYLFSNNKLDEKCKHQIKLLKNTKSFIDTIVPENKNID